MDKEMFVKVGGGVLHTGSEDHNRIQQKFESDVVICMFV